MSMKTNLEPLIQQNIAAISAEIKRLRAHQVRITKEMDSVKDGVKLVKLQHDLKHCTDMINRLTYELEGK